MVSSFFHCFKVYSSLKVFNEYFHSRFSMISRSSIVARSVMVSGSFLVLRSICLQWLLGTFLSESQFTIDLWKHGIFIIWLNIFSRNSDLTTSPMDEDMLKKDVDMYKHIHILFQHIHILCYHYEHIHIFFQHIHISKDMDGKKRCGYVQISSNL